MDYSTGITNLTAAKKECRQWLDRDGWKEADQPPAVITLQTLTDAYKAIPTNASPDTKRQNVYCFQGIVKKAYEKELSAFSLRDLKCDIWPDYMLACQGGKTLDLSTRRAANDTINSAIRGARSIFIKKLWPAYKKLGITFPEDILTVQWLPHLHRPKPPADDAAMIEAWRALDRNTKNGKALWRLVGLARFSGLRQGELEAIQRSWIIQEKGMVRVDVRDREEDGYWHKVGKPYKAIILDKELAADLLAAPKGLLIEPDLLPHPFTKKVKTRERWFQREPQKWVKKFTANATKPLHRLRSLYADDVADLTEKAALARQEGVKAAQESLGHTSERTTRDHYLSDS